MASVGKNDLGKRVVMGMDGSEFANQAFSWYINNGHKPEDTLILVHCPEYSSILNAPYLSSDPSKMSNLAQEEENKTKLLVAKLLEDIHRFGVKGHTVRATGNPGEAIVKVANGENASCVVMGARGLGKLRRTLMGSVSDYVLHHANCPVIVVPSKDRTTVNLDPGNTSSAYLRI